MADSFYKASKDWTYFIQLCLYWNQRTFDRGTKEERTTSGGKSLLMLLEVDLIFTGQWVSLPIHQNFTSTKAAGSSTTSMLSVQSMHVSDLSAKNENNLKKKKEEEKKK